MANLRIYSTTCEIMDITIRERWQNCKDFMESVKTELTRIITPTGNPLTKGKCVFLDDDQHESPTGCYFFAITRGEYTDTAGLEPVPASLFYRSLWGEPVAPTAHALADAVDLPF